MKKTLAYVCIAGLAWTGCKPGISPDKPSSGSADFRSYVALGNSLTAGYADGSLYRSGQEYSYPAILAGQFAMAGGGIFRQPLLPGESGWPEPKRVLATVTGCNGVTGLAPVPFSGGRDTAGSIINISPEGPFHNMGIPGIRCIDYTMRGYAALAMSLANTGFAYRFFADPMTSTPLEEALLAGHSFFSIWLGGNDVLGYALSGGTGNGEGGIGLTDISPENLFREVYTTIVEAMTAKGAKGVLINIPEILSIPFFTTIPYNGLSLDETSAARLTASYAALGIQFHTGNNPFIIEDASAPGGLRQIRNTEYILLSTPRDSLNCAGWGTTKPIPDRFVLSDGEISKISSATRTFNRIIEELATAHNLAHADAFSFIQTLQSGIVYNGANYTPQFVSGGVFSLDGIHLTARGYALVANEIIRAINARYGATLAPADVNRYPGVRFP